MKLPPRQHFLMRVRRDGPLVPAMLWWCDHDPADPANKLDRGRLSIYPRAAIAGEEVEPERILERLGLLPLSGDQVATPDQILARLAQAEPPPVTHWKWCQPVSEAVYQHHFSRLRWAERHRPNDPALNPRRDRVPGRGVGAAFSSRSPAGLAGGIKRPRRAA